MYRGHNYEVAAPNELPQDPDMSGHDWTFTTLEHGGPPVDGGGYFPSAILATDPEGRSHVYQATCVNGEPVHSKGYVFSTKPGARILYDPDDGDAKTTSTPEEK